MAYIYCADIYCNKCGEAIKAELGGFDEETGMVCIDPSGECFDPSDETSFDSGGYPKGPYPDGGGEADSPQYCYGCDRFLENPLTTDGEDYVRQTGMESDYYDWIDFGDMGSCQRCGEWESLNDRDNCEFCGDERQCVDCGEWCECDDEELCPDCAAKYDEPVQGDYTLTPSGPLGGKIALGRVEMGSRSFVGEFDNEDDAVAAARAQMEGEKWFTDIWWVSDHGNVSRWEG
jgi:hypothetical protein